MRIHTGTPQRRWPLLTDVKKNVRVGSPPVGQCQKSLTIRRQRVLPLMILLVNNLVSRSARLALASNVTMPILLHLLSMQPRKGKRMLRRTANVLGKVIGVDASTGLVYHHMITRTRQTNGWSSPLLTTDTAMDAVRLLINWWYTM